MSKSGRGENCMRGIIPAGFISSDELKLEYVNIPKAQRTTCRLKNFGNEIAQWIMNKFIVSPCKRSNIFNKSVKKLKLNKKGLLCTKLGLKLLQVILIFRNIFYIRWNDVWFIILIFPRKIIFTCFKVNYAYTTRREWVWHDYGPVYMENSFPGKRVTLLPEVPWASQLLIHFVIKRCERLTAETKR